MDNFNRALQTMDPATARLISSMLTKNLIDAETNRQILTPRHHHLAHLRQAALARANFLPSAPSPAAVLPAVPAARPQPLRPSPLDLTPTIGRSNSSGSSDFSRSNSGFSTSAMMSTPTHSSQSGMSTPPSQMSTPSSDCPPRLPRRLKTRKKRFNRASVKRRLQRVIKIDCDGDSSSSDDLTPAEMLRRDRKDILRPVMSFFDKKFLAPFNSPLWKMELKKTKGADGKTVMKKYPVLNLRLWQKLIRVLLKRIMGPAYLTNHNLTARFRFATKKIITKRRANHIQNYRLKGTHKRRRRCCTTTKCSHAPP